MYIAIDPSSFIGCRLDSPRYLAFCRDYHVASEFELVGDVFHCEMPSLGLEYTCTDGGVINAVFIFARPQGQNKDVMPYNGVLPEGVIFGLSREQARKVYGMPVKSGEAGKFLNTYVPAWDLFDCDKYLLLLQYSEKQDRIDLICVTGKSDSPVT